MSLHVAETPLTEILTKELKETMLGAIIITMENMSCYSDVDISDMVHEMIESTFSQYSVETCQKIFGKFKAKDGGNNEYYNLRI